MWKQCIKDNDDSTHTHKHTSTRDVRRAHASNHTKDFNFSSLARHKPIARAVLCVYGIDISNLRILLHFDRFFHRIILIKL